MKIYKFFFYLCFINNFAYSMQNAVSAPDNYQMYAMHDKSQAGKKINSETSNFDHSDSEGENSYYSDSENETLTEEKRILGTSNPDDNNSGSGILFEEEEINSETSNSDDDSDDSDYSNSGSGILAEEGEEITAEISNFVHSGSEKEEDTQPELNSNNIFLDINNIGKGITPETEEALRKLRSVGNFHIKKIGSIVVISIAFIIYKLKSKKGKKESNVDNKNNFICSHNHR